MIDLFVFALNLTVMAMLSRQFAGVVERASAEDRAGQTLLFALAGALFVLAPAGAVLARWHYHQRRPERSKEVDPMDGCLFNPIFYFCLTAVIFASVNAFVLQTVYGKKEPEAGIFVGSILLGIALMIVHTWLVYRYFSKPKNPPKSAFLRSRASAFLGDGLLFANMALFQLFWNLLSMMELPRPGGPVDFVLRLLLLFFLALLLYFPPRMFYLAEDIGKRRTWLMILVANSPILVRFLWGTAAPW
jgi:hypothetical protein